ncbi:MAG: small multi-drug export protein [Evtepia sp.]|uniref:COG2426 family protein n=1 Tax=Evtepia sp. TaxID=2773933 RepID=UPI002A750874|nr:small multi-drug export protein [Evtepia sp.]MDY3014436.1 small multi-drug export protein [Evtepia sp.]
MGESLLLESAATMGVAMVPVLELRGAIPFGLAAGLPPGLAYLTAVIGNMVPVPAIMLFIRHLFRWLRQRPWWGRKIDWIETRAHLKGRMVRKYRIFGLVVLVAVPLPGTGAWTGALVAALLRIRMQIALPAIFVGVLIAGGIVTGLSLGVISLF